MGHAGLGCVMQEWGGVGHVEGGGVGHVGMGWGVNNFICHKLEFLSSDKLLSIAFWIMWEKACFCL